MTSEELSPRARDALLAAAIWYARQGYAVFPLKPRTKVPLTKHGCLDATRDIEQIRSWWFRWPEANVGLHMGESSSGVWVLDVDGPVGEAALAELEAAHGTLPVTCEVITPRPGRHLYFRVAEGTALPKNSAGKKDGNEKLDTRSTGGYVVAPPSVHPDGPVYVWADGRHPKDLAPAVAPSWLVERFMGKRPSPSPASMPAPIATLSTARDVRRKWCLGALEAEARELAEAPQGTRNDKINSAAYKIGGYVGAGHLEESEVEYVLLGACATWAERDERKDVDTLRRGLRAGMAQPRALPPDVEARAYRQAIEDARRAAQYTLRDAFSRVADLRGDERARGLTAQAARLRDLVTSGALEARDVTAMLEDAANRCGLVDATSWTSVRALIAGGLGLPGNQNPAPPLAPRPPRQQDPSFDDDDAPPPTDEDLFGGGGGGNDRAQLPEIIDTFDEASMVDLADKYFADDDGLYQRGGLLVQALLDEAPGAGVTRERTSATIKEMDVAWLRALSTRRVRWMKWKKVGEDFEKVQIKPPTHAIAAFAKRGFWKHVRKLEGVSSTPVFRADGTVLSTPGYDAQSGVLYVPHETFPEVPDRPTSADVEGAVESLRYLVSDFPFEGPEHQAAWFASVLTPLARHSFRGPAPLFLIDANTPGTGKGKLATLTGIISTGRPPTLKPYDGDEREQRKVITGIAIDGTELVLFDNVKGLLGSGVLEAALTSDTWSDRVLGGSESYSGPLLTTWMATSNNASLTTDMVRRVAHIRLATPLEKPEERTGFVIPVVEEYARQHRPKLVAAALTILRAWHVAGRPRADLAAWGSYEGWTSVVRQSLVWAGLMDPGASRTHLREMADSGSELLTQLIEGLVGANASSIYKLTAGELLVKAKDKNGEALKEALEAFSGGRGALTSRTIGKLLSRYRGRIYDGRVIRGEQDAKRKQIVWWVERDRGQSPTTPTPTPTDGEHDVF